MEWDSCWVTVQKARGEGAQGRAGGAKHTLVLGTPNVGYREGGALSPTQPGAQGSSDKGLPPPPAAGVWSQSSTLGGGEEVTGP